MRQVQAFSEGENPRTPCKKGVEMRRTTLEGHVPTSCHYAMGGMENSKNLENIKRFRKKKLEETGMWGPSDFAIRKGEGGGTQKKGSQYSHKKGVSEGKRGI